METLHPIARYRQAKGLTLEAFGRLVGVNKAAVCKWEKGDGPSLDNARAIEEATNGALPKYLLRPDVWTPDEHTGAAA